MTWTIEDYSEFKRRRAAAAIAEPVVVGHMAALVEVTLHFSEW